MVKERENKQQEIRKKTLTKDYHFSIEKYHVIINIMTCFAFAGKFLV